MLNTKYLVLENNLGKQLSDQAEVQSLSESCVIRQIDYKLTADKQGQQQESSNKDQLNIVQMQNLVQNLISRREADVQKAYMNQIINGASGNLIMMQQVQQFVVFEEALWIRAGVIVIGPRNSGKSTIWKQALSAEQGNHVKVIRPSALSYQ